MLAEMQLDRPYSRRELLMTGVAGMAASTFGPTEANASSRTKSDSGADGELAWTPAWRLRQMFSARELSPLEFAEFLVARTERHSDLGAFITVFPEHLLEQARIATEQRGEDLPLLHGLPVSLKDNIFTSGQRTTLGSRLFKDQVPDVDSVASERLKKAGGIIFAKSNMPEFALYHRSLNLLCREALNPWDTTRTSGGSSGGAAVATAVGLGPLAVGTDGGGSIRLPSAFNGVFGMLPSRGRVPNGAGPFLNPSSGIGPMARDVKDAAMLLQAMACVDARDPFTMRTPPPDYLAELERGVKGMRMAWSPDLGRVSPDEPEVVDICHQAAQAFRALGADYNEPLIRLENPLDPYEPDHEYSPQLVDQRLRAIKSDYIDAFTWMSKLSREQHYQLTDYARDFASAANNTGYLMGIMPSVRYKNKTRLTDLFEHVDLLLCPTISRPAFICGAENVSPLKYTEYTDLINFSGYCAASVPAGFYKDMPVGLQIIGRPGEEALVLRAARAFERERPWAQHRPRLA
jgi:Asp-tRNA(Asn)/Glu-tRNA(Gln) amidotransferase A subunit family amidase